MTAARDVDLCVLGAGPVAAAVALGAAQLGARAALVAPEGFAAESGAVALAALAEQAASGRDWTSVRRAVLLAAAATALADAPTRLSAAGVVVAAGKGCFAAPMEIEASDLRLRARRIVVVPPAEAAPAVHTVLGWEALPPRLAVSGDGAEAAALAQALARLGVAVTLHPGAAPLSGFDAELAGFALRRLAADGVVEAVSDAPVLAAPSPRPALSTLGLAEAGVAWSTETGILADAAGRTSDRRVWVTPFASCFPPLHVAATVLRAALLRLPGRPPPPQKVAFTDPQVAQVGLDEDSARAAGRPFRLLRWPVGPDGEGLVKAVVGRRGRVLGAGIAAPQASSMMAPWSLAVARHLPATALAEAAVPWPSPAEAGRLAAASAVVPLMLSGRVQRWVRWMLRLAP